MQVDAATRRFPAQEIGLHLNIAIAEQQGIDAPAGRAEILKAVRRADRPVGLTALLQLAPVILQQFRGITPVPGAEFLSRCSQLFFRRHLGQDLARLELHDGAFNRFAQTRRRISGFCK